MRTVMVAAIVLSVQAALAQSWHPSQTYRQSYSPQHGWYSPGFGGTGRAALNGTYRGFSGYGPAHYYRNVPHHVTRYGNSYLYGSYGRWTHYNRNIPRSRVYPY